MRTERSDLQTKLKDFKMSQKREQMLETKVEALQARFGQVCGKDLDHEASIIEEGQQVKQEKRRVD